MSWFLFMDESGHDHQQMPYEVRGGFALAERNLWPLLQAVDKLEAECFGARLIDYKSELKGSKLLAKDRFKHAAQAPMMAHQDRRENCRRFLQAGLEKSSPRRDQMTAYGQACLLVTDGIFDILDRLGARVFASAIPRGSAKNHWSAPVTPQFLRKDHIYLIERFFYFLEAERQTGILVMDQVEEEYDRKFVQRLQNYFIKTLKGRERATWIVPSPFFVSSAMAIPVQIADIIIYSINWGYRKPTEMTAAAREEIATRFGPRLNMLKWKGDGYDGQRTFKSQGIFCVHELNPSREQK